MQQKHLVSYPDQTGHAPSRIKTKTTTNEEQIANDGMWDNSPPAQLAPDNSSPIFRLGSGKRTKNNLHAVKS